MTLEQFLEKSTFAVVNRGEAAERTLSGVFCCDLLSIAMSKAPADCVWVTVMGNMNTLAVASLTETACVILAEGVSLDDAAMKKAAEEGITVLASDKPIFETALAAHGMMNHEPLL